MNSPSGNLIAMKDLCAKKYLAVQASSRISSQSNQLLSLLLEARCGHLAAMRDERLDYSKELLGNSPPLRIPLQF